MKSMVALFVLMPALALAAGDNTPSSDNPPAFGLSGNVVGHRADGDDRVANETRRLLDQQAHSAPAEHSEISAPVYVQTQQRLGKSFNKDIPDFGKDQTQGGTQ